MQRAHTQGGERRRAARPLGAGALLCVASVCLLLAPAAAAAEGGEDNGAKGLVAQHSFRPPFSSFSGGGHRLIDGWRESGSADVKKTFVRLTPDRQSKRGALWSAEPLGAEATETDWVLTATVRISGQGRTLFGDGMGIFVTTTRYQDGPLLGYTDKFAGFGVLLDTFRNTDLKVPHKDVSIVLHGPDEPAASDGDEVAQRSGCDSNFRYFEGRDDFSAVNSMSVVRIVYRRSTHQDASKAGGTLSVHIDAKNSGEWEKCASIAIDSASLPAAWLKDAYVGVSASTGALADNHDIVSIALQRLDNPATDTNAATESAASLPPPPAPVAPASAAAEELAGGAELMKPDPRLTRHQAGAVKQAQQAEWAEKVETATKEMHDELVTLKGEMEHALEALRESLETTLKKLEKEESESQKRIDALEEKMSVRADKQIEEHADKLHRKMDARLKDHGDAVKSEVAASGGGWVWPFVALLLLVAAGAAAAVWKYRELRKDHLL